MSKHLNPKQVIRLYRSGLSADEVAKTIGSNSSRVLKTLRLNRVFIRPPGRVIGKNYRATAKPEPAVMVESTTPRVRLTQLPVYEIEVDGEKLPGSFQITSEWEGMTLLRSNNRAVIVNNPSRELVVTVINADLVNTQIS